MEIDFFEQDNTLIASPAPHRLDSANAAVFRQAVMERLGKRRRVVIDLRRVNFMDSAGVGALVSILKTLGEDARLPLVSEKSGIRMLIEITRLDRLMPVRPSIEEALLA